MSWLLGKQLPKVLPSFFVAISDISSSIYF